MVSAELLPFLGLLGSLGVCVAAVSVFFIFRRKHEPVAKPSQQVAPGLGHGLSKTSVFFQNAFDNLFSASQGEAFFQQLEETLLTADLGIDFTEKLTNELRKTVGIRILDRTELKKALRSVIEQAMPVFPENLLFTPASLAQKPHVVMIVGVNGAGKTTTVGKLCALFAEQGHKTIVGAADTFRAAATEQLRAWAERSGVDGVFHKEGSDPSAVAFDTVQAAVARGCDVALIDTAGRLHTKQNLMDELQKMKRVTSKAMPAAPHDILLVVDGTTGQNALFQAREFHKSLGLTGVIVTKLDGSAKAGILVPIVAELNIPVVLVGVGESSKDLAPFNRDEYIDELLAGL